MDADGIRARIARVDRWWHSIEVAPGIWTPGHKSPERLRAEVAAMRLDALDLRGKSVIDVGAWDGFFSFEAERRGAARVLALDHFVWCIDLGPMASYWESCRQRGATPEPYEQVPGLWRPAELPGKRGFDTARHLLGSRVEARVGDLLEANNVEELGCFDVAFYLGVLYHMKNPLEALTRLARITREVAVVETEAILVPGFENHALCEFYETSELNADSSNWWAPNEKALIGLCRAAGFGRVERVSDKPAEPALRERSIRQRWRGRKPNPPPPMLHYRAVVHAWK